MHPYHLPVENKLLLEHGHQIHVCGSPSERTDLFWLRGALGLVTHILHPMSFSLLFNVPHRLFHVTDINRKDNLDFLE